MFLLVQGWTPMHCAADTLHPGVMELLLKRCTKKALNAADVKVLLSLTMTHVLQHIVRSLEDLQAVFELYIHAKTAFLAKVFWQHQFVSLVAMTLLLGLACRAGLPSMLHSFPRLTSKTW